VPSKPTASLKRNAKPSRGAAMKDTLLGAEEEEAQGKGEAEAATARRAKVEVVAAPQGKAEREEKPVKSPEKPRRKGKGGEPPEGSAAAPSAPDLQRRSKAEGAGVSAKGVGVPPVGGRVLSKVAGPTSMKSFVASRKRAKTGEGSEDAPGAPPGKIEAMGRALKAVTPPKTGASIDHDDTAEEGGKPNGGAPVETRAEAGHAALIGTVCPFLISLAV